MEKNNAFLITGAAGFIGRHLVDELAKAGGHIICLVCSDKDKGLWKRPNVTAVSGNLSDKLSLEKAGKGADFCIHLAAVINSGNKNEFESVNVLGMSNLIEACLKNNIKKLIYVSSIDAEVNPDSLYGGTKLLAEDILKRSVLKFTILRPSVVYGAYDRKNVSLLIRLIRHYPVIPVIGDGEYKRQPLYVGDLIYAIKRCIELESSNGKTYNIGGPFALSMNEILMIIQKVLSKDKRIMHLPVNMIKGLCYILGSCHGIFKNHIQQILSIEQDKLFNIAAARMELDFKPVEFEHGLRMMFEDLNKNA